MAESLDDQNERAIEFLADVRFHRSLWLAPNPDLGRSKPLRITYSDIGHPDGSVVLSCGGLFSSRYTLAQADDLAKEREIRLITPDKPGVGGSELVELDKKVETWLDIVQALIKHLGIKDLSLIGHSSGAIYVLNTILYLRHLLRPKAPYAAILAPWVHPSQSKLLTSVAANLLPDVAIHRWYDVSYLTTKVLSPILGPSTARPGVKMEQKDKYAKAVDEKIMEYALAENLEGVSNEALFCLKRGSDDIWGPWQNYDQFVPLFEDREMRYIAEGGSRLTLDVFFAEEDSSSGQRGSQWFDDCWKDRNDEGCIHYRRRTVPGTNHETIMRKENGVIQSIFDEIGGL